MQPQDPNQPDQEPQTQSDPAAEQPQPTEPSAPTSQPTAPQPEDGAMLDGRRIENPLESMQPGERVICEIKRHPIGILGMYIALIFIVALIAILGYTFGPGLLTNYDTRTAYGYVTIAVLLVGVLCGLFGYVAHIVYWGNRWVVTDDSVTQIIQNSLFSKQSSQLSMANLEDITAEKRGIVQQMFNFGMLKCETAGAQKSKFYFLYCPNPEHYAKCILDAREKFENQHYRNSSDPTNPGGVNQNQQ